MRRQIAEERAPAGLTGLGRVALRVAAAFLCATYATCALGASSTANVPVAPFRLTDWSGETGLQFDYLQETQSQSEGESLKLSNRSFEEYLLLRLKAYVYHPRFLDIRTSLKLGMLQQAIEGSNLHGEGGGGQDSSTFVNGYDVRLDFLKEHPLSFSLFGSRKRDAVRQLFSDRFLIENETLGGSANWNNALFPMQASYRHNRFKEHGTDSFTESISDIFEYTVRNNIGRRMRSELRYRYQNYEQSFRASNRRIDIERDTEIQSHDIGFTNTYKLGRDRLSHLNSVVRLYSQTGTQELENFYWQERLQLHHTRNLQTYYLFNLLRNTYKETEILTRNAEAGLEYQLYKSLHSHVDVHWRESDFGDAVDTEHGVTGRLDYRKHTPWGYLTAGYGRTLDQSERTGVSSSRTFLDESITMNANQTQFLSRPNVVLGSIVVTDPTGLTPYTEGFDYEVETRGNRTGLRLLLTGLLSEGDAVLVDYVVRAASDIAYTSDDQTFNARFDFERYLQGLSVYYRWQDLAARGDLARDDLSVLIFTSWMAGIQYRWRWLTWSEEFLRYESNFSNYDQLRSQLEGRHRLSDAVRLSWALGMINIQYHDEDFVMLDQNASDILFASASVRGPIRQMGYWELEARARKETGLTEETLFGLLGQTGLRWRKLRIEAGARFERRERFDSARDRAQVFFQIAREFP